jgi:hypothetical protein
MAEREAAARVPPDGGFEDCHAGSRDASNIASPAPQSQARSAAGAVVARGGGSTKAKQALTIADRYTVHEGGSVHRSAPLVVEFDYSTLDAETAVVVQQCASRIFARHASIAAHIIEIGRDLRRVKNLLRQHGRLFGDWLRDLRIEERTAQRFMRAAEVFGDKSDAVSVLPPSAVYLLSAKSTPPEITTEVVADLEQGRPIDMGIVEARIITARREAAVGRKKQAKAQARSVRKRDAARWEKHLADEAAAEAAAEVEAKRIIEEVGLDVVHRIVRSSWRVQNALSHLVEREPGGAAADDNLEIPPYLDRRPQGAAS